jgi:hypothetical protein
MTHTLTLDIDYAHESAGWIKCYLTIDGVRHYLDASAVFPPFLPLLRFVKAVAGQRFPARFFWDEEGYGAEFDATAVEDNSALVHLKIRHYDHEEDVIWLDADIEREEIIRAFMPAIVDMSRNFLLAEKEWFMPGRMIEHLCSAIEKGIPLRSDIHSPQDIECLVVGDYDTEYINGRVFFQIIFEQEKIVSILLFDTHPFWQQVIDFFGHIASGTLPVSCEHLKVDSWGMDSESPEEYRTLVRLVAEPLDTTENFRLKIFTKYQDEPEFLRLDEVVNRRQFAHGFAASFKQFLEQEYQLVPDGDGKTFDLRSLSLEKLDRAYPH